MASDQTLATPPELPFADLAPEDFRKWYPEDRGATVPSGTFEIGLVLAGAVSAGAYTAGVLDFLFEALDAWNAAKAAGAAVPAHRVKLRVIAGASAGGINGAIAAAACRHRFPHGAQAANPFYAAWVEGVTIEHLLDPGDIQDGRDPTSLLNCRELQAVAGRVVDYRGQEALEPGARDWVAEGFDLTLTLTNLAGVPYVVRFSGGSALAHEMIMHRDHIAFAVPCDLDLPAAPPDALRLPSRNGTGSAEWRLLVEAALATGAFPLALEPREIRQARSSYDYRYAYLGKNGEKVFARPWPAAPEPKEPYRFLSADGGTMNNEPFDLAHLRLAGSKGRNPRSGSEANRAILLVDPFSEPAAPYEKLDPSLLEVAGRLLTAFKDQSRFKQIDLSLAEAADVYSRFLIAPTRRRSSGKSVAGSRAIASGGLGGFLGFFAREFRHHDFLLGRANCRSFLRDWFVLPFDGQKSVNPIFAGGRWKLEHLAAGSPFASPERRGHFQIVPLLPPLAGREPLADWPGEAFPGYEALRPAVESRLDALYPALREALLRRGGVRRKWAARAYLWLGWRTSVRKGLLEKIRSQFEEAAAVLRGGA